MRDFRHTLAQRRHQHHNRPAQLHRILRRPADPLQPLTLGYRSGAYERLRATAHHHLQDPQLEAAWANRG